MQVKDLKDQLGTPYPRPVLFCPYCGQACSANRGDYFLARPDYVFTCCGEVMKLVVNRTTFEEVQS